jgi:hypothetical protein
MAAIFVSYRSTSGAAVETIYTGICRYFGPSRVFVAPHALSRTAYVPSTIAKRMRRCNVVVVLIDQAWKDAWRHRSVIEDIEYERVLFELEHALDFRRRKRITIIPVLIHTTTPTPDELPESIRDLCSLQGVRITLPLYQRSQQQVFRFIRNRGKVVDQRTRMVRSVVAVFLMTAFVVLFLLMYHHALLIRLT